MTTSYKALICCGVIVGGFILGVDQEGVAGNDTVVSFGVNFNDTRGHIDVWLK